MTNALQMVVVGICVFAIASCGNDAPATAASQPAPAATTVQAATAVPAAQVPHFSEVRRIVVGSPDGAGKTGDVWVCLETGEVVEIPQAMPNATRGKIHEDKKIDAWIFSSEPDYELALQTAEPGIVVGQKLLLDQWNTLTAPEAAEIVYQLSKSGNTGGGVNSDNTRPVVYLFRSMYGVIGLARLVGENSDTSHKVTIEIKVWQK